MSRGAGHPKSGRVLFDICAHCSRRWKECRGTCRHASRGAELQARQDSILGRVRALRDLGVPECVLAPIAEWATVGIWLRAPSAVPPVYTEKGEAHE